MKPRILIVDDYEKVRTLLAAKMRHEGYEVVSAKNGVEALERIKRTPPDLILLDEVMPKMNGFEVCKRLKADENTKYTPIIFIMNRCEAEDEVNALELGVEHIIEKPYSLIVLAARVKSILRRKGVSAPAAKRNPKAFISYSWDSEVHKAWIRNFAKKLQDNGIEVLLDQWDLHPGIDMCDYMETSIRESDYVLLMCTPTFAKKANSTQGGVGYEKGIVTGQVFGGSSSSKKFVPLLVKGTLEQSIPSYMRSRYYLDFTKSNGDDCEAFEELLRHLYDVPKHTRPALGKKPF